MTASRSPYVLTLDFNPGFGMAGKDGNKVLGKSRKNKKVSRKEMGLGDTKESEYATNAGLENSRL